ncbi:GGDEF domain-containing protein [Bacillus suaedae]|uniref:GGDEF domain-containing protein n=1 Tax=Halalkalibacter suaedae TaxID=2822140 RepID=A0A941AQ92_9BACI|nr:GGDEF domain-containing protein [Bacillus suaedae]MBP3950908.1 GGDEF domain-containing protein [Bacillus suaedae]
MINKADTFDNIKRTIYFFASIFILIYLTGNLFLVENNQHIDLIIILLITYFLISLLLLKSKRFIRYHELINIALTSTYLIGEFYRVIHVEFLQHQNELLGDFIIWMPVYTIYLFVVFGKKYGLLASSFVFFINLLVSLPFINELTGQQIDSVILYNMACLIYILVIYSSHIFVSKYAELQALEKYAYYDTLTEIANRRKSTQVFEQLIEDAQSTPNPFSIIFVDIDYFKLINDKYGHDTGDIILKEFSSLIQQQLSANEFVGRWGGEEFIIFTPTILQEAIYQAEQLRKTIEVNQFTNVPAVTASIGVASYANQDNVDSLFKRADSALYEAKKTGRNCVCSM